MPRIIQCATCINEPATIEALQDIWTGQDEFNTHYLQYQDAARKYKCSDYMGAWA